MDARIKSGHDEKQPKPGMKQMCGMIAYRATISGANPISPSAIRVADRRGEAACGRGLWATPRAGTFARAGE